MIFLSWAWKILKNFWMNNKSNHSLWTQTYPMPIKTEMQYWKWCWIGHAVYRSSKWKKKKPKCHEHQPVRQTQNPLLFTFKATMLARQGYMADSKPIFWPILIPQMFKVPVAFLANSSVMKFSTVSIIMEPQ